MLSAASATFSWTGIAILGIGAGVVTASAGASDIWQGIEEISLGVKGDSETKTSNGLSDMLYDGNEGIYHTSTGIAAIAGNLLAPYVKIAYLKTPVVTGEKATEQVGGAEEGVGEYIVPNGGGGITSTIKVNGQTITFGHGGRHLEGTGLSVNKVNQVLANEVSTLNIEIGQFHKGQIIVDGITIEYTSYRISEGLLMQELIIL